MDITILNGKYNDGRQSRGIYPSLWLVTEDGSLYHGITAIETAGRVVNPVKHQKNGKWSNTDYELHGKNGDLFVQVQREWEGGVFPKAHSVAEAQAAFEAAIGRRVNASDFREALTAKCSARVEELDELEKKLKALNAPKGTEEGKPQIVNCTPHPVSIVDSEGKVLRVFEPNGRPIRLKAETVRDGEVDGVPMSRTVFGEPENLPEPEEGTYYIVSQLVKNACPDRRDLLVPAEVVRDEKGVILGCRSLGR